MAVFVAQQISMMAVRIDAHQRWKNFTQEQQAILRSKVRLTGAEDQDLPADLRWHLIFETRNANGWTQVWLPVTDGFEATAEPTPEPLFVNLRPPGI